MPKNADSASRHRRTIRHDAVHESAEHYATFVELWKDADPELQPRVEAALYQLDEIFAA